MTTKSEKQAVRSTKYRRVVATTALGMVALLLGSAARARAEDPTPAGTPPAPAASAPPSPAPAVVEEDGYRTSGLIPGVLLGPKVSATLLFPPNVMVGAEVRVIGYIGASFEYGVFPRNQTIQGYSGEFSSWSAGLRAYPFKGAFFVGAVLGRYDVTLSQASLGQTSTLQVAATYLGPQIGWKWTWDFGLFLGLNLGYGFSLDYQSTMTNPAAASSDLTSIQTNADKYLKTGIPILTLLEIGFVF